MGFLYEKMCSHQVHWNPDRFQKLLLFQRSRNCHIALLLENFKRKCLQILHLTKHDGFG